MSLSNILTVKEAADELGLTKWAVYKMIENNRLRAIRKGHTILLQRNNVLRVKKAAPAGQNNTSSPQ
jgi:excisionase family DNA binding protein